MSWTEAYNKTVGCHRHSFRLPILVKMPFKKMKKFFFKILSWSYLLSSLNIKFSNFRPKNLTITVEKTFSRNNIIWYAFYCKFAMFGDFEKFQVVFEKPISFFQKNPNSIRFEKSYHISRILRQSYYNLVITNFQGQKVFDWSNIGPYQLANIG